MFVSLNVLVERWEAGVFVRATDDRGFTGCVEVSVPAHVGESALYHLVMEPPYENKVDRASPKRRVQVSRRQEESLAKSHGGVRHRGSGNQSGYAGDVRADGRYRIEAKYTTHKSYSVTRSDLNKIRSECALGEDPVFAIDFKEPSTLRTEDSWVLVPRSVWEKHVRTSDDT